MPAARVPVLRKQRDTPRTITTTPPIFRPQPLITWEKLPDDFKLPDDPVDNLDQPLLAEALRDALEQAHLTEPSQMYATNFGICVTVDGTKEIKAPDWVYVPSVLPLPKGKRRKSYTPYLEGDLPAIVMEFLSDTDGNEYDTQPHHPYGKWYFYEQLLKVPCYVIFDPKNGALEVYQLTAGSYQYQHPDAQGRYWIAPLSLFLGVWNGTKSNVEGYWLRWWDSSGQLLPWGLEKNQQAEKAKEKALKAKEKALKAKKEALEKAAQAVQQTKLQIAQQMRQANTDIAFIMQVTGLDKASIENLKN